MSVVIRSIRLVALLYNIEMDSYWYTVFSIFIYHYCNICTRAAASLNSIKSTTEEWETTKTHKRKYKAGIEIRSVRHTNITTKTID